ncbi:MAG: hypothetical protein DRH23_15370 [Deltaproteobacteria bacterium]|nr:hypothetical protein [Deltaproteobacteria bacterium]MBW2548530.1 hypothetical protein [Deltaproteobacteria bacterium]RLB44876.1 MAG: hypothetical protein DRH23_15370 [Deltaproteobacteria bacterium]
MLAHWTPLWPQHQAGRAQPPTVLPKILPIDGSECHADSGLRDFATLAPWVWRSHGWPTAGVISRNHSAIHADAGLTPSILEDGTEPLSDGSNFLDVLPAGMLIHP